MSIDIPSEAALNFESPSLYFGDGTATNLPEILGFYDVTEPLVVTDEGIEAAGILERVTSGLEDHHTYHATTEPSTEDFHDLPRESVDGVVALGGGSCIDTAKMAAVLIAHGGHAKDYIGVGRLPGPIAPLIAIPTTSGTGSQATQTAVITHDGVKRGASDEQLRPIVALVDPSLTFSLPKYTSARSGFDAFVHALESLSARDYRWVAERPITYQGTNPISGALALRALRLVHDSLERAVFDSDDLEARRAMSLGSHLAGVAFSASGLGAIHAIASAVGGLTDRPHGECLAASIQPGLEYNLPVRRRTYANIAKELGLTDETDPAAGARALIEECVRLAEAIGLPVTFDAVGLSKKDNDVLVENTLVQERRLATNPRAVTEDLGIYLDRYLD